MPTGDHLVGRSFSTSKLATEIANYILTLFSANVFLMPKGKWDVGEKVLHDI